MKLFLPLTLIALCLMGTPAAGSHLVQPALHLQKPPAKQLDADSDNVVYDLGGNTTVPSHHKEPENCNPKCQSRLCRGWYCGNDPKLSRKACNGNNLYRFKLGDVNPSGIGACCVRCVVEPPGSPDHCA